MGYKIALLDSHAGVGFKAFVFYVFQNWINKANKPIGLLNLHLDDALLSTISFEDLQLSTELLPIYSYLPVVEIEHCTFCGKCFNYCAFGAIVFHKDSKIMTIMEQNCSACGACLYACNDRALSEKKKLIGRVNILRNEQFQIISPQLDDFFQFAKLAIRMAKQYSNSIPLLLTIAPSLSKPYFSESVMDMDLCIVMAKSLSVAKNTILELKSHWVGNIALITYNSDLSDNEIDDFIHSFEVLYFGNMHFSIADWITNPESSKLLSDFALVQTDEVISNRILDYVNQQMNQR
jgi:MinD superfamily P-loop ATPase